MSHDARATSYLKTIHANPAKTNQQRKLACARLNACCSCPVFSLGWSGQQILIQSLLVVGLPALPLRLHQPAPGIPASQSI